MPLVTRYSSAFNQPEIAVPQQFNQFEWVIVEQPQTGTFWGNLHSTFVVRTAPVATWAHTQLSTFRVYDKEPTFIDISFRSYTYLDEHGVQRTQNLERPENYWNLTNLISNDRMVEFTVQHRARGVGARGLVVSEWWSEPESNIRPFNFRRDPKSIKRTDPPAQTHLVALIDPQSGWVVSRHSEVVLDGGRESTVEETVELARMHVRDSVRLQLEEVADEKSKTMLERFQPEQLDVLVSKSAEDIAQPWWEKHRATSAG